MPGELSISEVAARYGAKGRTLRAAIARGDLWARKIGTQWVVTPASAEQWMRQGKHLPGPAPGRKAAKKEGGGLGLSVQEVGAWKLAEFQRSMPHRPTDATPTRIEERIRKEDGAYSPCTAK